MLFFELLQVAIGNKKELSQVPSIEEWDKLYLLAQKQAMVGIAFRGVEQLPEMQRPPRMLLMQWYMATERIKTMNYDLNQKALSIANEFLKEGFRSVILKGQGIAKLYRLCNDASGEKVHNCRFEETCGLQPILVDSISEYRTPGDIDIWLEGGRKKILNYVRRHALDCNPVYHHVDFSLGDGTDVEVHFMPSWMYSPVTNFRLQRFFKRETQNGRDVFFYSPQQQDYEGGIICGYSELPVPSYSFNRVYILVHIYRHLFHEGIGLRQLMDYYFVLLQGFTEKERMETVRILHSLKMERFAAAVMWILQEVFKMGSSYLITIPNEKEGRFLLSEIMLAGNFGQYDVRLRHEKENSSLSWVLRKLKRNFRFVRSYPSEVLWSPFFKLWHYFWRRFV